MHERVIAVVNADHRLMEIVENGNILKCHVADLWIESHALVGLISDLHRLSEIRPDLNAPERDVL